LKAKPIAFPSQGWKTLLRKHSDGITSIDMFDFSTIHSEFHAAFCLRGAADAKSLGWLSRGPLFATDLAKQRYPRCQLRFGAEGLA